MQKYLTVSLQGKWNNGSEFQQMVQSQFGELINMCTVAERETKEAVMMGVGMQTHQKTDHPLLYWATVWGGEKP
ncbi:hypothetical protein CEXT_782691 [Caerostris extrusa]|uniref:Uncharacterized protein n=1 Tax=Caerostris extrusa TaxID=172846 RepID=A0AAV4VCF1_CAEEX|nr:hypothetical protein CEXT_782691 [Caerostris extrusa]